jgi:hypothetical protein
MLLLLCGVEHPHEQVVATAARELSLFRFPSHRREGNWGHEEVAGGSDTVMASPV